MAAPQGVAWFYEMMSGFNRPCGEEVDRPPTLLLRPPRMTLNHKRKNQQDSQALWLASWAYCCLCGCPAAQQMLLLSRAFCVNSPSIVLRSLQTGFVRSRQLSTVGYTATAEQLLQQHSNDLRR
jgi:hypothetical protein